MLAQKPLNLNEIADNFDVTRQAVSLHVKILEECGLIMIRQQGRERYCEAQLQQLQEVTDWIGHCRQFWTTQFQALDQYLQQTKPKK